MSNSSELAHRFSGFSHARLAQLTGMDPRLVSLHYNHEIWLYLVRSLYSPTGEQTADASLMPFGGGVTL